MNDEMIYDKSAQLKKQGEPVPTTEVRQETDITYNAETDRLVYPSVPEVVDLPPAPGWGRVETVKVQDFFHHARKQCESSLERCGSAHLVFSHHVGAARGLGIVDDAVAAKLDKLATGLASASDQPAYFSQNIKPYLNSLRPAKK